MPVSRGCPDGRDVRRCVVLEARYDGCGMGRKADGLGAAFRASEGKVCAGMARRGGERTDGGPARVLRGPVAC